MEPKFPIFMPSSLPRAFGHSSVAQAKFFRNPFFTPSDVKRPVFVVYMVFFARFSVRSKFLAPKIGSAAADGKWANWGAPLKRRSGFACQFSFRPRSLHSPVVSRFNPAIVVMDLGFQIQGLLQEEESFSPLIRFEFLFNLGICQVQNPFFDSGRRDMGNRMESWMFVAAQFHGQLRMAMLDSTISSLESMSTVSVRASGELKDINLRSVADNGTRKRTEAQLSRRSLSPFFLLSVFASLVDGIISLICEDEWYASCLIRIAKVNFAQCVDPYDFGWVLYVSNSGLVVTMSLSHIMNWLVKFMNCCTVGLLSTAVFVV
uniref:Uncharacterized protein n=1 Tax=Opuntia streptacantha TaxID=393608 RepID=A0A7C9DJQ6_OPUST